MSRLIRTVRVPTVTLRPSRSPLIVASCTRPFSSTFDPAPSPPRLPADQQAEFERLQREAEARLSTHTTVPPEPSSPLKTSRHATSPSASTTTASSSLPSSPAATHGQASQGLGEVSLASTSSSSPSSTAGAVAPEGEAAGTFSGGIRKGAPPEFEGEVNPKTGEVGGPKNEPLRWGGGGDWSYNGRVTDF